jgi:hypothetical protein
MGLDWNPLAKAKPGHEAELDALFDKLDEPSADTVARFKAITDPPFLLLGAPQVGIDEVANAWLRARLEQAGRLAELDQAMQAMHGYRVIALLPPCDGFPFYSNHSVSRDLERYSFRGQFLHDVEDIIGPDLFERAFKRLRPSEHLQFGEQLLAKAQAFAKSRNVMHAAECWASEFDENTDAHRAHVMFAAARWCLYWARRGHGLDPWF